MSGSKLSDPASNPKSPSPAETAQWEDAPLGMTVHTLPNPDEVVLVDEKRTRAGRWKMLAVLLVCASPVIASYFTYYVIRPEGRRNHGELIQPQRSLPAMEDPVALICTLTENSLGLLALTATERNRFSSLAELLRKLLQLIGGVHPR